MKKSYNTKKPLSMLPLLALALFNTSMYSMEVVQPEAPQIVVFITHVENATNKDLTITLDDKDYVIKAGKTRKPNQEVDIKSIKFAQTIEWHKVITITHEDTPIERMIVIYGRYIPAHQTGSIRFSYSEMADLKYENSFEIKTDKSYDFGIQLYFEGENLEETEMEIVAVEK